MIETINFSSFVDGFTGSYKNNFSYDGKKALFDYIEETEQELDEQTEYDPISLCCEYTEYDDLNGIKDAYPDFFKRHNIETIEDHTTVIEIPNSTKLIIQNF